MENMPPYVFSQHIDTHKYQQYQKLGEDCKEESVENNEHDKKNHSCENNFHNNGEI